MSRTEIQNFVGELRVELPEGRVVADEDLLQSYRRDHLLDWPAGMPAAVVLPRSTEEVALSVRIAGRHGVGVIPRGAGSGLTGGAAAVDGCLMVSLERMDRIVTIDAANQTALVEPGVINRAVSDAAAEHGLFYPPDPASRDYSTIGGNIATNAGGLCCVKYGVTRDHVLDLEVVLADGSIIRTGRRSVKGVAGLDLTSLFVGSEGTLGIVTQALLRLRPRPEGSATVVAYFSSLEDAGRAVALITASDLGLSLVEIMDRASVVLVDDWGHFEMDRTAAALLILQTDEPEPRRTGTVERTTEICKASGAIDFFFSSSAVEADALLQARRAIALALESLGRPLIHEDVAVPRSEVAVMIAEVNRLSAEHATRAVVFGHAGDGNLHPVIIVEDGAEAMARGHSLFESIMAAALRLGGTITGEHGIGQLKARYLAGEVGERNIALQRSIKAAVDPDRRFIAGGWLDAEAATSAIAVDLRRGQYAR
ncbi:MAG: FAD-binding protein [Acidobacteria bacterium]|nr:FAD-binding protein [Acidobacteriota bacterium]